jgi:hypothetical protein
MTPEKIIQIKIEKMLERKGWFVKRTHGGMFQSGFPDDFASHPVHGHRWVEVKLPDLKGSRFTKAQLVEFPKFEAHGSGVWILVAATEAEYELLFRKPNWTAYQAMMKRY